MNILVTGGAGYKGVVLVKALLDRGHVVTVLDNFLYGSDSLLHIADHPALRVIMMDLRNLKRELVAGYDVVYHLAGIVGMPACSANPHSTREINVQATARLVEGLRDEQLLVFASTTSLYGSVGGTCDESEVVTPISLYGQTKYEAEKIVLGRPNSIVLRFATVFGVSPRMRTSLLVNDFAYRAVNDRSIVIFEGHSRRTFLHIKDAIDAYLLALDKASDMKGGIFNVGHDTLNFSKVEIAEASRRQVRCQIFDSSLADVDQRDFLISFQKIMALGFTPQRSLDDGVRELVALYGYYKCCPPYNVI